MKLGALGFKCGMSRWINDKGEFIPVTIVHIPDNVVTQLKTNAQDGYIATQLACQLKPQKINKAQIGHLLKADPKLSTRYVKEFRFGNSEFSLGTTISLEGFPISSYVDVTAISKGKGFAGVIRRWGFSIQGATHGNSLAHRAHGSTGCRTTPGKVMKGKKMAGHLGNKQITVQNLKVLYLDLNEKILAVKGAIPGPKGCLLTIKSAIKKC